MRILDWNIAHMNSWFVPGDDPTMRANFAGSEFGGGQINDVPGLARRAASVINALAPDVMTVQEGAGVAEVSGWADDMLEGTWRIFPGAGGAQKLLTMWNTESTAVTEAQPVEPGDDIAGRLTDDWQADVDADFELEAARFARPPLVVDLVAHGQPVRLLNCHSKSKFVKDGEALFNGTPEERQHFVRQALLARRRISAEGFRIREYLDVLLIDDAERRIVVAGDLNDGIGFDFFERRHLTHSVVDLIFGSIFHPARQLRHVLLEPDMTMPPRTAEFFDFVVGETRRLLLDHIGLSIGIQSWFREGRVADAEFDAASDPALPNPRERHPSDHRPVFAELVP